MGDPMIWIRPANENMYDFVEAFNNHIELDWNENASYQVGDTVYIYGSKPYQRITHKTVVVKTNISFDEIIDDLKYYKDVDTNKFRANTYTRLRLISKLNDPRLDIQALLNNGLNGAPQGPIKVKKDLGKYLEGVELEMLVERLNEIEEMVPDKHDGSYEYVREIVKSLSTISEVDLTNKDLNLLYFATVGTFSRSYATKIKNIDESNLSIEEKNRLKDVFNNIYEKAKKGFYENYENSDGKVTVGMFGTGIGKIKVSDQDSRNFIKLCIEILNNDNEDENIDAVGKLLKDDIKHLGTASLSQILHCLKPNTFPILTSNTIDKIFTRLGIKLIEPNKITKYAENTRIIRKFKNRNFKFKNYRLLDKYFWDLYSAEEKIILRDDKRISKEDWINLIKNKNIFYENNLDFIKILYDEGGEASPTDISRFLGFNTSYFNLMTAKLAKRIAKNHKMGLPRGEDGKAKWWSIIFDGRSQDNKSLWILKPELKEAIEEEYDFLSDYGMVSRYSKEDFLNEVFIDEKKYSIIINLLRRKKNIILQGAPGVGKTFMVKRLAYSMIGKKTDNNIEMVQFHQSYCYEDFIQGIKPREDGGFTIKNGVFYDFCKKAEDDLYNDYFFIIDEINRGNISKIFGELMMLLESDKRGPENKISLLYTEEDFSIPENLYLIGTMNTADRSLAILDYALRRRFSFISLEPAFGDNKFKKYLLEKGMAKETAARIVNKMQILNEEIEKDINLGKGFRIGHSYFCNYQDSENWYEEIIDYDIGPLLEEYWFDDENKAKQHIDFLRNE